MEHQSNKNKRSRSANYTEREKQHLYSIVFKFKEVLENKKTDAVSIDQKKQVWEKIAKYFNASTPTLIHRSAESLRKFYENRKKDIRKEMANERCEIYKTGGGPPPAPKKKEDEVLLSIVNNKTIFGLENPICDGDSLPHSSALLQKNDNKFEDVAGPSTSKIQKLQEPNYHDSEESPKLTTNSHEKVFEIQRGENYIEHEDEMLVHLHTPTTIKKVNQAANTSTSRRRPATVVKALSSSNIAEKYDKLLDQRALVYNYELAKLKKTLDNENVEHKLRVEALSLDIAIKKKQLKVLEDM